MIFINNSVLPERMSKANGVGQTLGAAARTAGPALGGLLWSAALKADLPGKGAIVFGGAALLMASLFALTYLYPSTIVRPYRMAHPPDDAEGAMWTGGSRTADDIMLVTIETPTADDRASVLTEASRIVVVGPERAAAPPVTAPAFSA